MRARAYQLARLVLFASILSLVPFADRDPIPAMSDTAAADPGTAASEVRLRKLHLVRPDLIPYPISFEVYC